ncbi:hypothetical protein [Paraburkholderia sp. SUR17]|uniref:hypothetical protein n=1 Tax=Paraburkholderia sp. SUR17 TaxID=3034358 RepID=UPI0024080C6B|nr:hypothetical protein [Paraburkholderia sp. SUR17]WEY37753.1 hypothetical protein P2869_11765 [Paraburkholderia sp. SUR17]
MDKTFVIDRIERDLGPLPAVREACLAIVEFLSSSWDPGLQRVTFGQLTKAAGLSEVDEVLPAVQYLSGGRLHLLEPKFEFIDLDTDTIEEVSSERVRRLRNGEEPFYHPDTGEKVENIERSLYMFFVPSAEARQLGRSPR